MPTPGKAWVLGVRKYNMNLGNRIQEEWGYYNILQFEFVIPSPPHHDYRRDDGLPNYGNRGATYKSLSLRPFCPSFLFSPIVLRPLPHAVAPHRFNFNPLRLISRATELGGILHISCYESGRGEMGDWS